MALFNGGLHFTHDVDRQGTDTKAGSASWLRRLDRRLRRWQQLHRERHQLWSLSDATLKDIGLTRADIEREASRPFWDDGEPRR
ncbi:DUF1127 domain-containing protein [Halomonas sp. HP20-15]|uniref:DUF1127 domain-containing protein n=1 Tax=Halomonas sp. HP20-15 TaxID=3085901 RepID=UPI0029827FE7|nr:DUF1127 domain-containing protein [Halomonas sp. HP20-15]MDW5377386.1 DUF1127 domain-containing protein [Halomonas sp. HP20-15]